MSALPGSVVGQSPDEIAPAAVKRRVDFSAKLDALAAWCDREKLADAAKTTRQWAIRRDPDKLYVFAPPDPSGFVPPKGASAQLVEWHKRFAELRRQQAETLFGLAKRAADEKRLALAYQLACETLGEDPDHAAARAALGYQPHDGGWATSFAVQNLKAGRAWHGQFGWLPKDHVARYEQGDRHDGQRWITAEQDAKRHADVRRGWRVETEHWTVTTNHSLQEAARVAAQLERLHLAWRQAFAAYWLGAHETRNSKHETSSPTSDFRFPTLPKHQVVLFRDRDEYNRALRSRQPRIEITLGIYLDAAKTCYFFVGKGQDPGTVFHEATHQLFKETRSTVREPGLREHFWIVEGAACYMESLKSAERGVRNAELLTLGGRDAGRVPAARERLLDDGFYVPLAELTSHSRDALQRHERIASLYSQSAGLTTFLMHAGDGRYRDALVRYLEVVYSGKTKPDTLEKLTAATHADLDRQYREFLQRDR